MLIKIALIFLSVTHVINAAVNNFWVDPKAAVLSITPSAMDTCAERQAPGIICLDCQTLARCVFRSNGWDSVPLEHCDDGAGMFCNANEQKCSTSPGQCNPSSGGGSNFACSSEGIFPDPFSCQMYHACFRSGPNLIAVNIQCGGNNAFNPATSDCSLSLTHQACSSNQFNCNQVGDMGAWPLNSNIYYICMARTNGVRVLFPQMYRCNPGQYFVNGQCQQNGGGGGGDNGNGSQFLCQRPGLFPDMSNCRAYFFCDGNLRSQHITCPTGTYFSTNIMGCVRGVC